MVRTAACSHDQTFAAVHASIHNHFNLDRHLNRRATFKPENSKPRRSKQWSRSKTRTGSTLEWRGKGAQVRIKHFKRIATRYEKHASNYLAMLKLAAAQVWLRHYGSMT
jgi:transposase